MVNSHPVMLLQICKANGINCKYLKKYVKHRDKILKDIIEIYKTSRDNAKNLFISLINTVSDTYEIDYKVLLNELNK